MDAVAHSANATTIATSSLRPAWLPAATATVFLALVGVLHAANSELAATYGDPLVWLLATVVAGGAVALAAFSLRRPLSAHGDRVDAIWLGYAVVVALWISFVETGVPPAAGRPVWGLSAVGPWVVVICLAIQAPRNKTLMAGLIAATMWPVAYAVNAARLDLPSVSWTSVAAPAAVNYGLALLACLIHRASGSSTGIGATPSRSDSDLGSYKLLAPIGSGGMGEVWRATHQMLARQAAIKLVRPRNTALTAAQKNQWVRRFHREANTIAGLQSPNTIYLYDFGVARDGQFYYVMELLDGISLDTLVKRFGPQPPARVRRILRQICESLEEAHQRNLVHRDLKPSNIMLCKVALMHDFVKVLDFGLAKCAACEDVAQITVENVAAGTPGYIAPEVALGEDVVDGRADVYALGCVAYFLLTGELVFNEVNPMTMVIKHVQALPVPPSQRTELPIPADLERIVMHSLEKTPSARPQSAREIAAMLDACELPPWTDEDAASWWERHLPEGADLRSGTATSAAVPREVAGTSRDHGSSA